MDLSEGMRDVIGFQTASGQVIRAPIRKALIFMLETIWRMLVVLRDGSEDSAPTFQLNFYWMCEPDAFLVIRVYFLPCLAEACTLWISQSLGT